MPTIKVLGPVYMEKRWPGDLRLQETYKIIATVIGYPGIGYLSWLAQFTITQYVRKAITQSKQLSEYFAKYIHDEI